MRRYRVLLAAVLGLLTGCYSYVPTRLEAVDVGDPVRLRVTADAAERLEAVRLTDARLIEGTIVRRAESELLVDTKVGTLDPQRGQRAFTQRINLPLNEIQEVESRRRDHLKSAAAIGTVALVVGVGIVAALRPGEGGPVDPVDPIPEMRPTLFRLRISF